MTIREREREKQPEHKNKILYLLLKQMVHERELLDTKLRNIQEPGPHVLAVVMI